MAVLFETKKRGVHYEVRTAGASRRLYTNGAFHTQYHPDHLFTGAVWDLLSLPSLCSEHAPARVLVLGVAGGTAIHQLIALHQPGAQPPIQSIVGIELDATHIKLALKYFDLTYKNLTLIQADAVKWLRQSRQKFDYIVDDVFLHGADDPERPVELDQQWYKQLTSHLKTNGVLVQNHIDAGEAKKTRTHLAGHTLLKFETPLFANQVIAAYPGDIDAATYIERLHRKLGALPATEQRRLRFTCKKFSG